LKRENNSFILWGNRKICKGGDGLTIAAFDMVCGMLEMQIQIENIFACNTSAIETAFYEFLEKDCNKK
jgi:hypothetical protein